MRLGLRQTDLAKLVGYDQTYLSALENGTKGPPTEELVEKLIRALELEEQEQAKLKLAVRESQKKYVLPSDVPVEIFKMMNELWDALDTIRPAQVQAIRLIAQINEQSNIKPVADRIRIVRRQKEVAKM